MVSHHTFWKILHTDIECLNQFYVISSLFLEFILRYLISKAFKYQLNSLASLNNYANIWKWLPQLNDHNDHEWSLNLIQDFS